jgi:hypothetical protein
VLEIYYPVETGVPFYLRGTGTATVCRIHHPVYTSRVRVNSDRLYLRQTRCYGRDALYLLGTT